MNNKEIRKAMSDKRIFSYEVAAALGISENTMCRKLRNELPAEDKRRVLDVINRLAREKCGVI